MNVIDLYPNIISRKNVGNAGVIEFESTIGVKIPAGHVGYLLPAKTTKRQGLWVLSANIAPGCEIVESGDYEYLTVVLHNASPTALAFDSEIVMARLMVVKCSDLSKLIGKDLRSARQSSSSSSKTNTSRGGDGGTSKAA